VRKTVVLLVVLSICCIALAGQLRVAAVKFPDVNCKFDTDCKITVNDKAANFTLPGTEGVAFLQSRLWPKGEAGTAGAGLYVYQYRIDCTRLYARSGRACIYEMTIDFGGPVAPLDYNGDGQLEQVFLGTQGGVGKLDKVAAQLNGTKVTLRFSIGTCAGAIVGGQRRAGDSSLFFGMASKQPHREVTATLNPSRAGGVNVAAWAPLAAPPTGKSTPPARAPRRPGTPR